MAWEAEAERLGRGSKALSLLLIVRPEKKKTL